MESPLFLLIIVVSFKLREDSEENKRGNFTFLFLIIMVVSFRLRKDSEERPQRKLHSFILVVSLRLREDGEERQRGKWNQLYSRSVEVA